MVASGDLKNNVDLETAADLLENVMYEPEQFPRLIYRMRDPKTVLLLFASARAKKPHLISQPRLGVHGARAFLYQPANCEVRLGPDSLNNTKVVFYQGFTDIIID